MKKIPTLFVRDWDGDRSRVLNQVNPDCQWVLDGEGVPTRKLDGTCCMIDLGDFYKRREIRKGDAHPEGFILEDEDEETGKIVGWVPVRFAPEDKYHREAFAQHIDDNEGHSKDGTYELVGPKIQGNPEGYRIHCLVEHGVKLTAAPRSFDELRAYFEEWPHFEGVVWHHPDGRMAKIKMRDFGMKRLPVSDSIPQEDTTAGE